MTNCFFIRHAERLSGDHYNPDLRIQDNPLTPAGELAAVKLAEQYSGRQIDAVYASQYHRTQQTAAPAAALLGLDVTVDPRLNEIDNGRLGFMSDAEVKEQYPQVWQAFRTRDKDFRFPEGETGEEARARVAGFLEETARRYPAGTVLVFCHDGLIRLMMCHILGLPVYKRWNFQVDYCGLTEIVYQPDYGEWKVLRYNQICFS